jgi:dTDP-4-amino-4,6-dideoxygalactose transaminase
MYKFSIPTQFEGDLANIKKLMNSGESYTSDGYFYSKCQKYLTSETNANEVFITPSGTSALEMMAQIIEFQSGDELIVPSYTFSSTAMAFLNAGAKLVFVDVTLRDGCISTDDVISNISDKTKAILAVSYGGRLANQKELHALAKERGLLYLEDNAQSIGRIGLSKGIEPISSMSCISFHSTKNINAGGEGGALLINDVALMEKAWNIRDKGTNRQSFLSGEVSKYQWISKGGSHILGESGCAILASQLQSVKEVTFERQAIWRQYRSALLPNLNDFGSVMFDDYIENNGHIFAVMIKNIDVRDSVIKKLRSLGVSAVSHYEPLHTSPAAIRYNCRISASGCDISSQLSKSIIRLPSYLGISEDDIKLISKHLINAIESVTN